MRLVVIYGPPGVGKLMVASELSRLTGFRLYDNHRSIDAVLPVFDFGDPRFGRLVERIRSMVLEEAAEAGIDLIFTFVYSHPQDRDYLEGLLGPVERRGGEVLMIQLVCDVETNERRFVSPARQETSKLTDLQTYRRIREEHDLWTPFPGRSSLIIDNTFLEPEEVAVQIASSYDLPIDE